MALYDSPPQVDPATGRLPSYKQVLQQDPTTGMYKIKYEYTPIVSSSTQGQTLQTMLTTPITTLAGSMNIGVGSQDGDAEGRDTGDTGDTGVGGATSAATGGGGRDQGGVYDFQRAQRDGGGTPFASDDRSELQKQLDTAYPTVLERGLGIAGSIFLSGVNPVVGKLGTAFMTNQRKNAIEDIDQAIKDRSFLSGYKTSEIAKALEDNSNLPDNVANYMRETISMASRPVKRSTVLEDAPTTSVIQAQPGFDPSLMDVSPGSATTPLKQTNIGDTIAARDEAAGVQTGDAAVAEAEAPGKDYGWNSTDGSTMTSNSTTTNADGTTTTNPSGLQTANQIVNEGTGGSSNYSQNQVNNAQAQVNGAVKTGGAGYGLPDGVKAVGTGYNPNTGNYSGTVSYSGGTVTNDPSKNKKLQEMKDRQNRGRDKIVCTMMNETYGFGSFRNKIWLRYAKDNLSYEYQVGYHKLFLPLVNYAKGNKLSNLIVKKILEHIARHRTLDIRQEMKNSKKHTLGRIYRNILEPLCYVVGKKEIKNGKR